MEQELAFKLQKDGISYLTQVELPVATADFYFTTESRPLIVFVDGRVHIKTAQMFKDEELRSLLRKKGYKVLELVYSSYSDKKRDDLYQEILQCLWRCSATAVSVDQVSRLGNSHIVSKARLDNG